MKKEHWKTAAAAAFLIAAGISYCLAGPMAGRFRLPGWDFGTKYVLNEEGAVNSGIQDGETSGLAAIEGGLFSAEEGNPAGGEILSGSGAAVGSGGAAGNGGAAESGAAVAGESLPGTVLYVHVCGQVKTPGVYELKEGSRIFDAVEAAGGFTEEADERSLNLAAPAKDGMQVNVYSREEALTAPAVSADGDSSREGGERINLNRATEKELMELPGVGESRAGDIIRYREESGGFRTIEEIMNVPGIKDASFQKIKDRITV